MFGNGSALDMALRVGGPWLGEQFGSMMARERSAATY